MAVGRRGTSATCRGRRPGRARCSTRWSSATSAGASSAGMEFLHVNAQRIINEVAQGHARPLPLHDQRVPGMQPRLHVLLRPADARVPRPGLRATTSSGSIVVKVNAVERLRAELGAAALGRPPHRHGHEHRPLPAVRGQVPPHAGHRRGAGRGAQPVLDPHQVDADPARPRRARGGGRRTPTCAPTSRSARSTSRSGARPSRARPTRAGGSRRWRGSTRRASPAGCSWRRCCRALRRARAARGGGEGVRRRRRGVDRGDAAAPAARRARALVRVAAPRAARPGRRARAPLPARLRAEGPPAGAQPTSSAGSLRRYGRRSTPMRLTRTRRRPRRRRDALGASSCPSIAESSVVARHGRASPRGPPPNRGRDGAPACAQVRSTEAGHAVDTGPSSAARTGAALRASGDVGDHAGGHGAARGW